MYSTIKQYYSFVERLKKEKAIELEMTLNSVRSQMDIYMATAGWQIKGKPFPTPNYLMTSQLLLGSVVIF